MLLKQPYGVGVVDVPDHASELYLDRGWVQVGSSDHPAPDPITPPPHAGAGSSRKAWAKYKQDLGIAEPDDPELTRDELIARIAAKGFEV